MSFAKIPNTMRAVALSKLCTPKDYGLADLPVPGIAKPDELLVRVHAASVNPDDVKLASSIGKLLAKPSFPYKVGYDLCGHIVAIGSSVTKFKVGDEVYSRAPSQYRGSLAQYCLSTEGTTALKPKSIGSAESASIPLAAMTALHAMKLAEQHIPGGLEGKTVFVPAGLSGTGMFAVQLASNVFSAGKVITTLSTRKIPKIKEYLGDGTPDQLVDYTKDNVVHAIGPGTVDFMFDTVGSTISCLPAIKKGGLIVSISTVPNGSSMKKGYPAMPIYMEYILHFMDWGYKTWTKWKGVRYIYLAMEPKDADLDTLAKYVDDGRLKTVVGNKVKLADVEGLRKGCQQIYDAKGGVGKFVVEID